MSEPKDFITVDVTKHYTVLNYHGWLNTFYGSGRARPVGYLHEGLEWDNYVGCCVALAGNTHLFSEQDYFDHFEWTLVNRNNCGGSDTLGRKVDFKGTNIQFPRAAPKMSLYVPPKERHEGFIYISGLTHFFNWKVLVYLTGWIHESEMTRKLCTRFGFEGRYQTPIPKLHRMADLKASDIERCPVWNRYTSVDDFTTFTSEPRLSVAGPSYLPG